MRPTSRLLLTLTLTAAAALVPAAANADTSSVRNAVNAARSAVGLPALTASNPTALQVAQEAVAEPRNHEPYEHTYHSERWAWECRCDINLNLTATHTVGYSAHERYMELITGDRDAPATAAFWALDPGMALPDALDAMPGLSAVIFDPRAVSLDIADSGELLMLAVTIDRNRRFAPRILSAQPVDPTRRLALLTDGNYDVKLRIAAGRAWRTVGTGPSWDSMDPETGAEAPTGTLLTYSAHSMDPLTDETPLAWGARYQLASRAGTFTFTTAPAPDQVLRGDIAFKANMTRADRRAFRAAVRAGTPAARRVYRRVAGLLTASTSKRGLNGDLQLLIPRRTLRMSARNRNFGVWFEIGQRIFELVDPSVRRDLIRSQPRCNPRRPTERERSCWAPGLKLSDTFAKWALNDPRHPGVYHAKAPRNLRAWGRDLPGAVRVKPTGMRINP